MARATALAIEPLLDAAAVGPGVRVLDVGCGLGTLAAAAAARGATVTGVDLASGMLEEARRRHPSIEFVLADAEALPFADGAFDVALGAFVVNHLPHPERAAAELARVAAPRRARDVGPGGRGRHPGLPARAAADLEADVPTRPGLPALHGRRRLAALIGGTVTEFETTLPVDSPRRTLGRRPRRHGPHRRPPGRRHPRTTRPRPHRPHRPRRAPPHHRRATPSRSRSASPPTSGAWPLRSAP